MIALARLVLARDTERDGCRDRATKVETVSETPIATTGSIVASEDKARAGVSLSRVPGGETPETPQESPPIGPQWGEAGHEGSVPRARAEGFARLAPDRPPGDVPPRRWLRFVDDVGRFLDSPFCAVAAALGWGPLDLFGCDRERPFARIGQAGLLWLLNGDRLLALTENTATIAIKTGAQQTYPRKPSEPGRVLAWELAGGECR